MFGPATDETKEIVSHANKTMNDMNRMRVFFRSIETTIKMLKTDKAFREKFDGLINLAKSPFVQALLGGSVDIQTIEMVIDSIINDKQVSDVIEIIGNIFDCFSADRFVPVNSEKELEDVAYDLAKKKLFYAAFFFNTNDKSNETTYTLRMEVDNTPVTVENRNRFWFPGPESSFELEMRYHRGFIQIQNSIDAAIIKVKKKKQFENTRSLVQSTTPFVSDDLEFSDDDGFDDDEIEEKDEEENKDDVIVTSTEDSNFEGLSFDDLSNSNEDDTTTKPISTSTSQTTTTATGSSINLAELLNAFTSNLNTPVTTKNTKDDFNFDDDSFWDFDEAENSTSSTSKKRRKRQLLNIFGFNANTKKNSDSDLKYEFEDMTLYTKQFPYPKHTRDDFKKGLYLAQAIQMSFFFALIILISSSVRQKIWFKESGNLSVSLVPKI